MSSRSSQSSDICINREIIAATGPRCDLGPDECLTLPLTGALVQELAGLHQRVTVVRENVGVEAVLTVLTHLDAVDQTLDAVAVAHSYIIGQNAAKLKGLARISGIPKCL